MKNRIAALALLAALALTGCAGEPGGSEGSMESAAPLVAETPQALVADDAEIAYLAEARDRLPAATIIPEATDEQLLAAGHEACERREAGEAGDAISLIEGEERNEGGIYLDSQALVGAAWITLCPTTTP